MSAKKQIDETVRVPAAVAAAAARADEVYKQAYPTPSAPAEVPAETPAPAPTTTEVPSAAEVPVITREGNAAPQVDDWEHRFKSMKGRFDRAQEQVRSLSEQISSLQSVIATMQQPEAQDRTPVELRAERLLTPEEVENYGEDFLNVVGKRAKEQLSPEVHELKQQLSELQARLQGVTGAVMQDARSKLITNMDEKCPRWRELNDDPNFVAWLGLPDPYSGAIRHELLKGAYEQNNTPRVLAFFNGFLAEEAATAPAETVEPDQVQAPNAGKVPLEALAAPGRAKSAAHPPAEKPIITRRQISQFYIDLAAGKYRGRETEAQTLERQIFDAQREGRISS